MIFYVKIIHIFAATGKKEKKKKKKRKSRKIFVRKLNRIFSRPGYIE